MTFNRWIDTFLMEKDIDPDHMLEVEGASGLNFIPVVILIDAIKATSKNEQSRIKTMLVRIDFANGNVLNYFKHLAQAIAI